MQVSQNECVTGDKTLPIKFILRSHSNNETTVSQDEIGFTLSRRFRELLQPMVNFGLGYNFIGKQKKETHKNIKDGRSRRIKSFIKDALEYRSWLVAQTHRM